MTTATLAARMARLAAALDQRAPITGPAALPLWEPIPDSPQADAFASLADIIGFGGEPGGGKSWLAIGLALMKHRRSLLLRREERQVRRLWQDLLKCIPRTAQTNENFHIVRNLPGGAVIELGGMKDADDWKAYQGDGRDLFAFDEATEFLEDQFRTLIAWNRSEDPRQHCQVVLTFNPPTTVEGRWVLEFFAAWLDPGYPNPAAPGELRWYVRGRDEFGADRDIEVPAPQPHQPAVDYDGRPLVNDTGEPLRPRSRTFFPAGVEDNPYYRDSGYLDTLYQLPEYRRRQLLGDFLAGIEDDPAQLIPTEWVELAFDRWERMARPHGPMSALGVDVAEGGRDNTVLAPRWGIYIGKLLTFPGALFRDVGYEGADADGDSGPGSPADTLRRIIEAALAQGQNVDAQVSIDVIGHGTGGGCYALLRAKGRQAVAVRGDDPCDVVADGGVRFVNLRSWLYWNVRMYLDPAGPPHTRLALPRDRRLLGDLTTPPFTSQTGGIKVESKREIKKRLGRSTDYGDATAYACYAAAVSVVGQTRDIVTAGGAAHGGRVRGRDGRWVPPAALGGALGYVQEVLH